MTTERSAAIDPLDQLNFELAARIRDLMFRRQVGRREIAAAIGLTGPSVSMKLNGQTKITLRELYEIARLLDEEPGDLLPRLDSNQQPSGYLSLLVSEPQDAIVLPFRRVA